MPKAIRTPEYSFEFVEDALGNLVVRVTSVPGARLRKALGRCAPFPPPGSIDIPVECLASVAQALGQAANLWGEEIH